MSEQSPEPSAGGPVSRSVAALRASANRRPVPWAIGGLVAVLVVGSGGAVAVGAASGEQK